MVHGPSPARAPAPAIVPVVVLDTSLRALRPAAPEGALARNPVVELPTPAVLWRRFAPRVRQRLLRLLGAAQDFDDLVQDVFLQVFRSLRRLLHPHALEDFVLAVANNVARAEIRRRRVLYRIAEGR